MTAFQASVLTKDFVISHRTRVEIKCDVERGY